MKVTNAPLKLRPYGAIQISLLLLLYFKGSAKLAQYVHRGP